MTMVHGIFLIYYTYTYTSFAICYVTQLTLYLFARKYCIFIFILLRVCVLPAHGYRCAHRCVYVAESRGRQPVSK
jgi:hypothetical protein